MCNPDDRQEYIFLKAFGDSESVFDELDIYRNMKRLSHSFTGNNMYVVHPRSIESLYDEMLEEGLVERLSVAAVHITPKGVAWRERLEKEKIVPDNKKRGIGSLNVKILPRYRYDSKTLSIYETTSH